MTTMAVKTIMTVVLATVPSTSSSSFSEMTETGRRRGKRMAATRILWLRRARYRGPKKESFL